MINYFQIIETGSINRILNQKDVELSIDTRNLDFRVYIDRYYNDVILILKTGIYQTADWEFYLSIVNVELKSIYELRIV